MDVVGGVLLADDRKASIVSGIDDHSRFIGRLMWCAGRQHGRLVTLLAKALRAFGVPEQVLTDNGEVLFDRICRENGIRHILTAPYSPTTTGKVDRWHKTLRREFLNGKVFDNIEDAQTRVDAWVKTYNFERRHQGIGMLFPMYDSVSPEKTTLPNPPPGKQTSPRGRRPLARSAATARSVSFPSSPNSGSGLPANTTAAENTAHSPTPEADYPDPTLHDTPTHL